MLWSTIRQGRLQSVLRSNRQTGSDPQKLLEDPRDTAMVLLMAVSIVPAELCEDGFYLLLCVGNLVPEDLEKSCVEPVRRTQI